MTISQYQFDEFVFDTEKGCLFSHNEQDELVEVKIRHKVAELLQYLIEHADSVVSKDELLDNLWANDYREAALTQSIGELRKALGDSAKASIYIKTYPQRGYQFVGIAEPCDISLPAQKKEVQLDLVDAVASAEAAEAKAQLEQTQAQSDQESPQNKHQITSINIAIGIVFVAIVWFFLNLNTDNQPAPDVPDKPVSTDTKTATAEIEHLLVLPFINQTQDPNMRWLELGLADMLAIDIQSSLPSTSTSHSPNHTLQIIPPATASQLVLQSNLNWPSLPVNIQSLLKKQNFDVALFAAVRLVDGQQVLDYQLIFADGTIEQASLTYESLVANTHVISQQVLSALQPKEQHSNPLPALDPIAGQAIAQGMQALRTSGPIEAERYFRAALAITDEAWVNAFLAQSLYQQGKWRDAETLLQAIPVSSQLQDSSLAAFIKYYQAELAWRRGDADHHKAIAKAIEKAEAANDHKQIARAYKLQANLSWQNMDWDKHSYWLNKADSLLRIDNDLAQSADRFFYIGHPTNTGLEKSPNNDLSQNKRALQTALNYYQKLDHQAQVAATELAIAQNYKFDLPERERALNAAIEQYQQLNMPFELAQSYIYAGFYQLQLHQGLKAAAFFSQARQIATALNAQPTLDMLDFYDAFALMDQGLEQRQLGKHSQDKAKLAQAKTLLEQFNQVTQDKVMQTSSLVFLGWIYADLGQNELAIAHLMRAEQQAERLALPVTANYARYSLMYIHLQQKDYQTVIKLGEKPIETALQANYLARAYYQAEQTDKAVSVLTDFKTYSPELWQTEQADKLSYYQARLTGQDTPITGVLADEAKPHLVYCESDWLM
ncbi:winged helix-turn-helix domain-containing protein [Catenovulum sp. SM1970]|uniref:winged helix-turn-helix domain-containing protein n=1 Tax=Marinifaba aquimaris TaxID=2741323 RepID=UPI00157280E2|nr:winged helix-turn-helix domain-containing protein [Marinifaba aquimaris]NTS78633.1 winged helix-turn-helix domain-containing protein [Marinifaba aquimaris]